MFDSKVYGEEVLQDEVLENLASAKNYRNWICALTSSYLGRNPIELGSGMGDHIAEWLRLDPGMEITATEALKSRVNHLRIKFEDNPKVKVEHIESKAIKNPQYSAFISINVLEHISDDQEVFANAKSILVPGGFVVSFVPASQALMSKFDRRIGHFRRYSIKDIEDKQRNAGLEIVFSRHVNFLGYFAWLFGIKILGISPKDGIPVKIWDSFVVPISRFVEKLVRPPIGQSILSVSRVPKH